MRQFQSAHPPLKATGAADAETQAALAEAMKEDQNQEDIGRKLFALGGRSYERGKYGHAYAFFTRAGELADRPGITFSRAQALRRLGGRREEAIALYEQYLATGHGVRDADAKAALNELKTPDKTGDKTTDDATAKGIFNKGGALYEAGDYAHAYDEFSKAGELADRPGIIFSRAQALRRMGGRREEAIALYEQYLARGDGARKADAEAALKELRAPEATGDEDKDNATAKGIFNKGGALTRRATTATPTTSSRARASSPTAPGSCSHARRRCAGSAAARPRRWRSTSSTSTSARAAGSRTPSRCSSCCSRTAPLPRSRAPAPMPRRRPPCTPCSS